MSPALGISRGDMSSELPMKSSLANLPGTRASRREQTSSCACSNSKTCKTHRHSAGNKEYTGSTLTARTGFCLLGLMRKKPLRWRGAGDGEQRNGSPRSGGRERERKARTRMRTHAHTTPPRTLWSLLVRQRPWDKPTACQAGHVVDRAA